LCKIAIAVFVATCAQADVPIDGAPAGAGPKTAAILPLHGEITDVMVASLRRRIDGAMAKGAAVIVFDMDTPGGLVTSSLAISDQIKSLTGVRSVAWINPNAISGGALVAVACDEIVMARSARIGDSQVIMGGPSGVTAVPEDLRPKAYTPVLHEFRTLSTRNGYSQVLSEAFVIPEREVWWLEHVQTGEREFVFRDEKMKRLNETGADTSPADSQWKLVPSYFDVGLGREVDVVQPVDREDQLLQMSPGEAHAYGFSKGIVADEDELRTRYGVTNILRLGPTWSESLAYWLTSMYVRGFLLVVLFLAAYVEFHSPGIGLPGLVALIALAIFVGAPYLTGLADAWEVALIVVGFGLIALELFVITGFGVAGIGGILLVLVGLVATFVPPEPGRSFPLYMPTLDATVKGLEQGVKIIALALMASLAGMVVLSRYLPKAPLFRRLVPANPTPSQVQVEDPYRGAGRVGDLGEALGPLRPAGKARFGAVLIDVVTQGEFLEGNALVEVVERRGNRVVVRAARSL